jgi:hypothetical protein
MFLKSLKMKHIFTLLAVILIGRLNAQAYPSLNLRSFYKDYPLQKDLFDSAVAANHYLNMTRTLTKYDKKGTSKKRTDTFILQYDDKGYLTSVEESNSKNKRTETQEYTYKDSVIVGYKHYRNNKLDLEYEITRNAKKKIVDLVKKTGKGEIIAKQHNDYDESVNRLSRIALFDKNNKEKSAIEYSYHDSKNMKQAKEYKNGKLKKVWSYSCDPAGTEEKKVKEMKVCKNVNVDENGNRVETSRIVNPKGDVELRVNTFDKNDKMIKQTVVDDIQHKLISDYTITYSNGIEEIVYKVYSRKKRPIYINTLKYNGFHKILSSEFTVGKKLDRVYKRTFQYNDKNLLTNSQSFDSKGKKTEENIHTYN